MRVRLLLFGPFRQALGADSVEWDTGAADMAGLWREMAGSHPALNTLRPLLLMSRNLRLVKEDAPVAEGDEVAFFPIVSGG